MIFTINTYAADFWNIQIKFLMTKLCVCVGMCTWGGQRPEGSIGFPRAEVIVGCEPPNMDAGNWTLILWKAAETSLQQQVLFLVKKTKQHKTLRIGERTQQ